MIGFYANLLDIFDLIIDPSLKNETENWFLHFNNCNFLTNKASRYLWQQPYYLAKHLNPYYSSWIILIKNYQFNSYQTLNLNGLIIVMQYSGNLMVNLKSTKLCYEQCGEHHLKLMAGESLIFISHLWSFYYAAVIDGDGNGGGGSGGANNYGKSTVMQQPDDEIDDDDNVSITFIIEIDLNL